MTSMRELRRRLLRWDRYVQRYPHAWWLATPPGHDRAANAVADEWERRNYPLQETYPGSGIYE